MKHRDRIVAVSLAAALGLTGCSTGTGDVGDGAVTGTDPVATTEGAAGATLPEDYAEAVAKLQTTIDVVTTQLDRAEVPQAALVAWAEVEARVSDAVAQVQSDPGFDMTALGAALDSFEAVLVDIDAGSEVDIAWTEFRAAVDDFVRSFAG